MALGILPIQAFAYDSADYEGHAKYEVSDDCEYGSDDYDIALEVVLPVLPTPMSDDMMGEPITVYITFEGYNLGHGFYIEPTELTVPAGSTVGQATFDFLTSRGHTFSGTPGVGFILDNISGFNRGFMNPPEYITITLRDDTDEGGSLGMFMYSPYSGWMVTVNHAMLHVGAGDRMLNNNDVIRWQFSVQGIGADLGVESILEADPPLYTHEDKTNLIRALFHPIANQNAAQAARDIIINPLATVQAIADAVYALVGDADMPGQLPQGDGYFNGWYVVHNPDGQLRDRLLAIVDQKYDLPPLPLTGVANTDNPLLRERLSVVTRLRIIGTMQLNDFRPGTAAGASFGTGLLAQHSDANINFNNLNTQPAVLNSLIEIDFSEVSEILNENRDRIDNFPNRAFRGLRNLESVRLSAHIGISNGMFQFTPNLSTLVFGDEEFTENVFDFRGLETLTFGGGGSWNFDNSGAIEVIFPAGVTAIPGNMFNNNRYLEVVRFYGAQAPSIGANAFNNITPRPVAIVPNNTTGGYEAPAFMGNFSLVISRDGGGLDLFSLFNLINTAAALSSLNYTSESWALFTPALTAARSVMSGITSETTQADIDAAIAQLQMAIAALEVRLDDVTFINVPSGSHVGAFRKGNNHFTAFTVFPVSLDEDLTTAADSGREVWRAAIALNQAFHIEVYVPGETAKQARRMNALTAHGTTVTVTPTPISDWVSGRGEAWHNDNVYTNLGDSGAVNLAVGQSFDLDTFRVWQAMEGTLLNYFIEPEYRAEIVYGSSASVGRVGNPGREQFRITGNSPGLSIIRITYGPIEYVRAGASNPALFFGAIDPGNILYVPVFVGSAGTFNTGINIRNDFDTYYFDGQREDYRAFTFTPAVDSSVRVRNPVNGVWAQYDAADVDDSFTVRLHEGRNIIEITNNGSVRYHVVHARGVSVTITNTTNPGQNFTVGDTASITITGLMKPIEKLTGIYNPGFGMGLRAFIRYTNDAGHNVESDRGLVGQFTTLSDSFTVTYTLTNTELNILDGRIHVGHMGDPLGTHRNIPLSGVTSNMTAVAVGPYAFGALPIITLPISVSLDLFALNAAITAAQGHTQADYTVQSWSVLQTALSAAIAVRDNTAATQSEVDAATSVLQTAINGLVTVAPPILPDWQVTMNRGLNRIVAVTPNPEFGVVGGEWLILALARAGHDVPEGYFEAYIERIGFHLAAITETNDPNNVVVYYEPAIPEGNWIYNPVNGRREVRLGNAPSTENARLIVALTALGIDASAFEFDGHTYDLVARLGNRHSATSHDMFGVWQGVNGPIWNLIALYSRDWSSPYVISDRTWVGYTTAVNPITLNERITWVLGRQLAAGGWALSGTYPGADMTGMALQALAPFRGTRADVDAAINRAITWLSQSQTATGGWGYAGAYNVQSTAQVIVALTALGIDPQTDARFVMPDGNPITSLLSFHDAVTGGFTNSEGNVDLLATEQATYALVAYYRFINEMNPLYDMSDVDFTVTVPEISRAALNAQIARAESLVQANFTPATWAAMQTVLNTARTVRDNTNATQYDIDAATMSLTQAIEALVAAGPGPGTGQPPATRRATISVMDPNAGPGQTRMFFAAQSFELQPGETAYSLLRRTGLNIASRGHEEHGGRYVWSINGWGEFDDGPYSGWMFSVNGDFPRISSSLVTLQDGDRVEWLYTRELGDDLGGNAGNVGAGGSGAAPGATTATPTSIVEEEDEDEEETTDADGAWINPFDDVAYAAWYRDYIRFMYAQGLMQGTAPGQFSPSANLSRAMVVTILWRHAGAPVPTAGSAFNDVQSGRWYSDAIAWAAENGIVQGFGDGRFAPSAYVTREQLAVILQNFAEQNGQDTAGASFVSTFADAYAISDRAQDAMRWANANGLINGRTATTLAPGSTTTRAETAAIIYRFIASL